MKTWSEQDPSLTSLTSMNKKWCNKEWCQRIKTWTWSVFWSLFITDNGESRIENSAATWKTLLLSTNSIKYSKVSLNTSWQKEGRKPSHLISSKAALKKEKGWKLPPNLFWAAWQRRLPWPLFRELRQRGPGTHGKLQTATSWEILFHFNFNDVWYHWQLI